MLVAIDGTGPPDDPARRYDRDAHYSILGRVRSKAHLLSEALHTRVPGLGEWSRINAPVSYEKEMQDSFCMQAAEAVKGKYYRGPTGLGWQTSLIAEAAAAFIADSTSKADQIFLVGYSRGACAAIITAKRLQERSRKVEALFLFDAVDIQLSELSLSREIVNAANVYHARAETKAELWTDSPYRSRFYFYNTGLRAPNYLQEKFGGTHAALGGLPWEDVPGDRDCAVDVKDWMNPFFLKHLGVQLDKVGVSRNADGPPLVDQAVRGFRSLWR